MFCRQLLGKRVWVRVSEFHQGRKTTRNISALVAEGAWVLDDCDGKEQEVL